MKLNGNYMTKSIGLLRIDLNAHNIKNSKSVVLLYWIMYRKFLVDEFNFFQDWDWLLLFFFFGRLQDFTHIVWLRCHLNSIVEKRQTEEECSPKFVLYRENTSVTIGPTGPVPNNWPRSTYDRLTITAELQNWADRFPRLWSRKMDDRLETIVGVLVRKLADRYLPLQAIRANGESHGT